MWQGQGSLISASEVKWAVSSARSLALMAPGSHSQLSDVWSRVLSILLMRHSCPDIAISTQVSVSHSWDHCVSAASGVEQTTLTLWSHPPSSMLSAPSIVTISHPARSSSATVPRVPAKYNARPGNNQHLSSVQKAWLPAALMALATAGQGSWLNGRREERRGRERGENWEFLGPPSFSLPAACLTQ